MSRMIFQISDSGAFSEPDNGLELLPTSYGTAQRSRYNVVKIAGRKGGISQYMGADRKQFSIAGIFLGNAESISTKRQALENLIWNTDSAERGKSISMSTVYAEGMFTGFYSEKSTSDPSIETWSDETDSTYWMELFTDEAYVTQSTDARSDTYAIELVWPDGASSGVSEVFQTHQVLAEHTYTFSIARKFKISDPYMKLIVGEVIWMTELALDEFLGDGAPKDFIIKRDTLFTGWRGPGTSSWTVYDGTFSAPTGARYVRMSAQNRGEGSSGEGILVIDDVSMSGDDRVFGYTESQNINIKGYNISQRRGAKNIYDVSIDMEEEY